MVTTVVLLVQEQKPRTRHLYPYSWRVLVLSWLALIVLIIKLTVLVFVHFRISLGLVLACFGVCLSHLGQSQTWARSCPGLCLGLLVVSVLSRSAYFFVQPLFLHWMSVGGLWRSFSLFLTRTRYSALSFTFVRD